MDLSRKWLNEFVDLPLEEVNDHAFAEAMSVSGSKVEVTRDLSKTIRGVVVGRIVKLVKHPNSDHMLIAQLDVGGNAPVQICTGAWNVHVGELVPAALDGALLPNGAEIRSGKLRGADSQGMLCSLKELGMTAHDFPEAVIVPAAILGDYHPLDPNKPSIPSDIKPGDRIFGNARRRSRSSTRKAPNGTANSPSAERRGKSSRPARTSTSATSSPSTRPGSVSARSRTCTPDRKSSRTASETASSSCRRTKSPARTWGSCSVSTTTSSNSRSRPTAPTACA